MKKLPLGIQSFSKIINGGYLYVDKTQYIYNLINGASYYFLSRPRRFGKSLLLDTIGEVFNGGKELFADLWIHDSGYDFTRHPVIRLDMSNVSNETPDILKKSLSSKLKERIEEEGLNIDDEIPSDMFSHLIKALHKKYGQCVVVLIDEYDKPILDHLTDIETAEANRMVIKGFYGVLKSMDAHLRFTMITGVSKFTKTSIFSELNNLLDITMMEEYANICGVEIDSLDEYFGEHIKSLSTHKRFAHRDNIRNDILSWYDGYSWDGETRVLNPFSLLSFFIQKRFVGFWFSSGSPTFLIKLLKEKPESFLELKDLKMLEMSLDRFDIKKIAVNPLLFQTGYLTVKEVETFGDQDIYSLTIPNLEVEEALYLDIIAEFSEKDSDFAVSSYRRLEEHLKAGDLQSTLLVLRALFASIPYNLHVDLEAYYHSIFYAVMSVLGLKMNVEVSVSGGRVDAVLELSDNIYVMEFKYKHCDPSASPEERRKLFDTALEEGMSQIHKKGYYKKYLSSDSASSATPYNGNNNSRNSVSGNDNSVKTVHLVAFAFLGRDNIDMRVEQLGLDM